MRGRKVLLLLASKEKVDDERTDKQTTRCWFGWLGENDDVADKTGLAHFDARVPVIMMIEKVWCQAVGGNRDMRYVQCLWRKAGKHKITRMHLIPELNRI